MDSINLEEKVVFFSEGIPLAGILGRSQKDSTDKSGAAVILAHGYANYKGEFDGFVELARALNQAGFITLRFDFRGCGESGSPKGHMFCATEWPVDLMNAVSYLLSLPDVDPKRIGAVGQSMGGAAVSYVSTFDNRIHAAVSGAAPCNGERWLHELWVSRRGETAWQGFLNLLAEDRIRRSCSGSSKIMEIPEMLASSAEDAANWRILQQKYPLFLLEAPLESIDSALSFRPVDTMHKNTCPIRFIHGSADVLVSAEHSRALFGKAAGIKDLQIVEGAGHDLFTGEFKKKVQSLTVEWLDRYLNRQVG